MDRVAKCSEADAAYLELLGDGRGGCRARMFWLQLVTLGDDILGGSPPGQVQAARSVLRGKAVTVVAHAGVSHLLTAAHSKDRQICRPLYWKPCPAFDAFRARQGAYLCFYHNQCFLCFLSGKHETCRAQKFTSCACVSIKPINVIVQNVV